ncbi:MAG: hypothetical protein IJM62_01165 [Lachnospiraceae bacterium]|nr:hypothetical protein [Lachnospiraceae bacterium]
MAKILCFGDSNTLGLDPMDNWEMMERSWPVILGDLVENADIEIDGVCHRTTSYTLRNDPETNGIASFKSKYIDKREVFDVIIIMLGTNDSQRILRNRPEDTGNAVKHMVLMYKNGVCADTKFLIISPPLIGNAVLGMNPFQDLFDRNSVLKSKRVAKTLLSAATASGADFMNADSFIKTSSQDGVHFSQENHAKLAAAVARKLELMGI